MDKSKEDILKDITETILDEVIESRDNEEYQVFCDNIMSILSDKLEDYSLVLSAYIFN